MQGSSIAVHSLGMRAKRRFVALVGMIALALLAGPGCSRVAVHTMADPEANFTSYATFKILPRGGEAASGKRLPRHLRALEDPAFHDALHEAIHAALVAQGLRPAGEAEPDLVIGYQTAVRNQADVMPPVYGVGWRGHVYVRHPGQLRWYKEGTLVIDVVDAASRTLVWRGVGVGAMRDMHPGAELNDAVLEILKNFPPEK